MIAAIPITALLLALFAAYIAVRAEQRYALRYVLIAAITAFGVGFFFLYPAVLGRPKPTVPTGDFHLIAMTEQPDHYVEMWVGEKTGSRLYRFQTSTDTRQKLRGMTDGKGVGIYSLTGHFVKPGGPMGNEALQLDVTPPNTNTLPPKNEP